MKAWLIFLTLTVSGLQSQADPLACSLILESSTHQYSPDTIEVFNFLSQPIPRATKKKLEGRWSKIDRRLSKIDFNKLLQDKIYLIMDLLSIRTATSTTLQGKGSGSPGSVEKALQNFDKASAFLVDKIKAGEDISESLIKRISSIHLYGVQRKKGHSYRTVEAELGIADFYRLIEAKDVSQSMKDLVAWYHSNKGTMHAIELAARFYQMFISIHPFIDANGRTGRDLMDFILMRHGYPPVVFDGPTVSRSGVTHGTIKSPSGNAPPGFFAAEKPVEPITNLTGGMENTLRLLEQEL